jgi:hypothetical protein
MEYLESSVRAQIKFWLMELRTPELLRELAQSYPFVAQRLASKRPMLEPAVLGDLARLEAALGDEQSDSRALDREYLLPLREELERLRHPK